MDEAVEVNNRPGFFRSCFDFFIVKPVVATAGVIKTAAKAAGAFIKRHDVAFNRYTMVYEFLSSLLNFYALGKVIDAFRDVSPEETKILEISLTTFCVVTPVVVLWFAPGAALTHYYTNLKYLKSENKEGEERPLLHVSGEILADSDQKTKVKKISVGRWIYIGYIISGDGGDHIWGDVSTGVLFAQSVTKGLLTLNENRITYGLITLGSVIASWAQVRVCKENVLEHFRGIKSAKNNDTKADFFTWFQLAWGGLVALLNSYSCYGLTLDSMTGAEPEILQLSSGAFGLVVTVGVLSALAYTFVHFVQEIGYQNSNAGFRSENVTLNTGGEILDHALSGGDVSAHVAIYVGNAVQIRRALFPKPSAATLAFDLSATAAAGVACIAETGICREEITEYLKKYSLFSVKRTVDIEKQSSLINEAVDAERTAPRPPH